jgi:hypothetical protein
MANPTRNDEESEAIRQGGSTPEDGTRATHPGNWPGIPPADDEHMKRSAGSGDGEVPERDLPEEPEPVERELPSNRAQERGGP